MNKQIEPCPVCGGGECEYITKSGASKTVNWESHKVACKSCHYSTGYKPCDYADYMLNSHNKLSLTKQMADKYVEWQKYEREFERYQLLDVTEQFSIAKHAELAGLCGESSEVLEILRKKYEAAVGLVDACSE